MPTEANEPPRWFTVALSESGVRQLPGGESCRRIEEYHRSIGQKEWNDRVPWCSSFLNWCVQNAGLAGTNSALARSWLDWGSELQEPKLGCVVVLWRGSRGSQFGHVGLYLRETEEQVCLFGGNQLGKVGERWYSKRRILGFRWPN